ncbi:MAG: methyltransferase family protein [Candidatus Thorarchaeota archaeon]
MQSLVLPVTVTILVPLAILLLSDWTTPWLLEIPLNCLTAVTSVVFVIGGLYLLASTIRMFAIIGQGTLAPWNPTQRLVIHGIYRYVRNPMITGVLLILLGESIFFASLMISIWLLVFFIGNHVYFIKSEEPGLVARFGDDYLRYAENVPRWIPRRTPWDGTSETT